MFVYILSVLSKTHVSGRQYWASIHNSLQQNWGTLQYPLKFTACCPLLLKGKDLQKIKEGGEGDFL